MGSQLQQKLSWAVQEFRWSAVGSSEWAQQDWRRARAGLEKLFLLQISSFIAPMAEVGSALCCAWQRKISSAFSTFQCLHENRSHPFLGDFSATTSHKTIPQVFVLINLVTLARWSRAAPPSSSALSLERVRTGDSFSDSCSAPDNREKITPPRGCAVQELWQLSVSSGSCPLSNPVMSEHLLTSEHLKNHSSPHFSWNVN